MVAVGIAFVVTLGIYLHSSASPPHPIFLELFIFSLTIVLGGIFGLALRSWETRRQRRESKREALRDFSKELVQAYNSTKKVRRMLRAKSAMNVVPVAERSGGEMVNRTVAANILNEIMPDLVDAQLKFEALRRALEVNGKLFGNDTKDADGNLKVAESYLRAVCEEYEKVGHIAEPQTFPANSIMGCFFFPKAELERSRVHSPEEFKHKFSDQLDELRFRIVRAIDRSPRHLAEDYDG